jgi:hypothetical protein
LRFLDVNKASIVVRESKEQDWYLYMQRSAKDKRLLVTFVVGISIVLTALTFKNAGTDSHIT